MKAATGFASIAAAVAESRAVPKGWFTVWDESDKSGRTYTRARQIIAMRFRRGELERRAFPNPSSNGMGGPIYIYREKKQ